MSIVEYNKALKIGEKSYKYCISKGKYPYLPVLEDMLSKEKSASQVKLGLVEIPIELIAGTYTSGRTTAFSSDFMPLLEPDTEFAAKWSELCDSMEEEGQINPIVAYEYMNRFYVVEGNKRVSVSKYMGAVSLEGVVTRIIPQENDSKDNRVYYEFLDFYDKTKINYILMNKEGSYEKLYHHIHPQDDGPITEDEALEIKSVYSIFKKAYYDKGGEKLNSTIGEVLLAYIEVFGFEDVKKKSSVDIKKDVNRLWPEFVMLSDDKPFSVIMDPTDESQKKSITRILTAVGQPMKVAFVHYKSPENSGWSYAHEIGKMHVQKVFGDKIQVESFATYDSSDYQLLENLISDGYKVIFTTTPVLNSISLRCAVSHPEVIILNCSLNIAYRHVRTYYLRIYEAKFIIGAIAGTMTEENRIGYIADYPIFGMPASVNAFALGVKLVNPRARVYLDWSTMKDHDPFERFCRHDVDIISNRDLTASTEQSREYGLYAQYGDTRFNIAMPLWNWGVLYETLIRSILNGAWKNDENANGIHALNYYWGMSSEAIDILFTDEINAGTRQLINILKKEISSGDFNPFSGKLFDQEGKLRNTADHIMTPEEIINMDWFVDNISGSIPDINELDEGCHELLSHLGIKRD